MEQPQTQTPAPINPLVHTATRTGGKIIKLIITAVVGFHALILLLLGLVFAVPSYGSLAYSAQTEGSVTSINPGTTQEDGQTYCTFGYSYGVNNKQYTGTSFVATPESCGRTVGSVVNVKYDPSSPTRSSTDDASMFYIGVVMAVVGGGLLVLIGIGWIVAARIAKRDDRNNDGLFNDDMPATTAQLNVIESGMRDLGEFWVPRKMTQQEARDVIADINRKLAK